MLIVVTQSTPRDDNIVFSKMCKAHYELNPKASLKTTRDARDRAAHYHILKYLKNVLIEVTLFLKTILLL